MKIGQPQETYDYYVSNMRQQFITEIVNLKTYKQNLYK